jgi:hypothetical protein
LADSAPVPLFFPENAMNPAEAQRLPSGRWWLPSPASGNRIDLGTRFFAYRMVDGFERSGTVMWTSMPAGRFKLHMVNPTAAHFDSVDGSDPNPKVGKGFVEVTLTNYPLLITQTDEIPIPELAFNETNVRYDAMLNLIEGKNSDAVEERYAYSTPLHAFDLNPGGAFAAMRAQYERVATLISTFTWIEGESTRDHNFSGPVALPECSGTGALLLRTRFDEPDQQYQASYTVMARSGAEQEVWVAAKLPPGANSGLEIAIGSQIMTVQSGPLSPYGSGFAWYKMGTTRLTAGAVKIMLRAHPDPDSEVAVDVILLYPGAFTPSGVVVPDPVDFETLLAPVKKGKKKGSGSH